MKRTLKIVLILLAIIALLLGGAYLYLRFMPEKSVSGKPADFVVTATQLASEYQTNPGASDVKYIDRVLEISGTIAEITTDQNGATVIILRDEQVETGVLCTLTEETKKQVAGQTVGGKITIKGTCTGMLFEVVLNKCIILDK